MDHVAFAKRFVQRRLHWSSCHRDYDDLVSAAALASWQAERDWGVDKGCSLETYRWKIVGYRVIDALRELHGRKDTNQAKYSAESQMVSLDKKHEMESDSLDLLEVVPDPNSGAAFEAIEAKQTVDHLLEYASLSETERLVLQLYYWDNWSLWQIGEFLGVTESRASQLASSALRELYLTFQAEELLQTA